jgi:hypothetical protein
MAMCKSLDIRYQYCGPATDEGVCRLRIFEDEVGARPPVVVVSALAEAAKTSVTTLVEYLAAEVLEEFLLPRGGEAVPFLWVEYGVCRPGIHAGEVEYVRFAHYRVEDERLGGHWRRRIGPPTWFAAPCAEVEALTGEALNAPEVMAQVPRKAS